MNSKQFKRLVKQANTDDVIAQKSLAEKFATGDGVDLDHEAALHWYERAADCDDPEAKYKIAMMYLKGEGVKKNLRVAVKKLKDAVKYGSSDAALALGDLHSSEESDIDRDPVEAARHYFQAVVLGSAQGIRSIASLLDENLLTDGQLKKLMWDFED